MTVDGEDTFPAATKQAIKFKFTAETTPIRNGEVSFTIPATLGSQPQKADSEDKPGKVDVAIDGGTLDG